MEDLGFPEPSDQNLDNLDMRLHGRPEIGRIGFFHCPVKSFWVLKIEVIYTLMRKVRKSFYHVNLQNYQIDNLFSPWDGVDIFVRVRD